MKTKITPLILLIPTVVLAQPAPQAPQSFQAAPPVVNQQVNPASSSSTGTAAQTLVKQNSSSTPLPVNPVAAAAYEKASKSTQSMSSSKTYRLCAWVSSLDMSICT